MDLIWILPYVQTQVDLSEQKNYINKYDMILNQRGYPISTMLVLTKLP